MSFHIYPILFHIPLIYHLRLQIQEEVSDNIYLYALDNVMSIHHHHSHLRKTLQKVSVSDKYSNLYNNNQQVSASSNKKTMYI